MNGRAAALFAAILLAVPVWTAVKGVFVAEAATPGDVVINEIMYNPGTGNQNDEFLELYNTTGSAVSLEGWSFTAGIDLTFGPGASIPANGYVIISPNGAQTLATYGVNVVAQYIGNLSNGGETVTLRDEAANIITSVTYSDASPWPSSPDGTGPSLERRDAEADADDPLSWYASATNGGTPVAVNSTLPPDPFTIENVTEPQDVAPSTATTITADVSSDNAPDSVELHYKINFTADVVVAMVDDGTGVDAVSGDGTYSAQIPGQTEGTLIRYRILAENGDGTGSLPKADESIDYRGYYIENPALSNGLPMIEWFIDPAIHTDLMTNHRTDKVYVDAVVGYSGKVYDNAKVRIRGTTSSLEPKASFKFKLPSGYTIQPQDADLAINEFSIVGLAKLSSLARVTVSWWALDQAGLKTPDVDQIQVNRNGAFEGAYIYTDKYDKEWQAANGFSNKEMYDSQTEVHANAPDTTRLQNFTNTLSSFDRKDPALYDYLLDNVDIPNHINHMAGRAVISQLDTSDLHNIIWTYDSQVQRWASLTWDLDMSDWSRVPQISPYDQMGRGQTEFLFVQSPIQQDPDLRAMYMRRLRTLYDQLISNEAIKNKFNEFQAAQNDVMVDDLAKWPQAYQWGSTTDMFTRMSQTDYINQVHNGLDEKRRIWHSFQRIQLGIPDSQTDAERQQVNISAIMPHADDANEYVVLTNDADTAVDVSGWTLQEINVTLKPGTVIPAGKSIYLVKSDVGYRAAHPSTVVATQYATDLGEGGTLTLRTNTNAVIDTRGY